MKYSFAMRLATGLLAFLVAVSVAFAQEVKSDPPKDRTDDQQQTQPTTQDNQDQAQQDARDAAQQARDKAREAREDARDQNLELRQDARQELRGTRDNRRELLDENRDARREAAEQSGQRTRSFFRGRTAGDLGINFDDERSDRLTVLDLDRNSLAGRIGLRRGDVILSINGRGIRSGEDFNRGIAANPGRSSSIVIQRNGRQYALQMQPWSDDRLFSYESGSSGAPRAYLGVTFDPNYREFAVIREVKSDSPAEMIGLKPGDTLTHIDGQEVRSLQHAVQTLAMMPPGEEFDLEYDRPRHESVRVAMVEKERRGSQNTFDAPDRPRQDREERQENRQDRQN